MNQPFDPHDRPAPQPYYEARPEQPAGYAVQPYQPMPVAQYPAAQLSYPTQFQPALVSAAGRLGARLLDTLLLVVTFGIGWLIWSMVTWSNGQTPAKQLLGQVVADANTGEAFDWGRMALRCFVIEGLLGMLLNAVSCGIYFWVDALMVFGDRQRTLHDRMAGSIVRHR
ncbi:hypothetical protein GCM10010172_79260 [Paractinoplanes ferrugineus]|uniref:RDD domain-containing protein n=1 Tax=Paractinoplanes ferrugineus TaxID=113564 RepID=A0A919J1Y1_9ACTN|nr:RDD family protein [Actinoplanes ferrugineus]GIE13000.1 hypothetical protein Afe05nite_48400 [Actinoplanes ferrugineus]